MVNKNISLFRKRLNYRIIASLILMSISFLYLFTGSVEGSGQLLCDSGFEASTATNGPFPTSGCWKSASAGGGAYASVTETAARSGKNGLWIYTGTETDAYWSRPYQESSASPGQIYSGSAWIRTPSGQSWVEGSTANVRIEFLNNSRSVLATKNSSGVTAANSDWVQYSVTSDSAPENTKYVRFICNIEKPNGTSGISVANFDDTFFELSSSAPTPSPTPTTTSTTTTSQPTTTTSTSTTTTSSSTTTTTTTTSSTTTTSTTIITTTTTSSTTTTLRPTTTTSTSTTTTSITTTTSTTTSSTTTTTIPESKSSVDLAYQHQYEVMDKYHNAFDVYTDQDAGGNHFYPSGWMGDTSSVSYDGNWTKDYHDGTSCIKITFTADGDNWAGIYWQDPENNWGTHTTGGYDLSGATKITFWAKGEKGGEQIEFFAGGITGDNPDSFEKTYAGTTTVTTLSNSWKEYTIDLASKDLSHIIGGFGWAANSDNNPNGATFYLDDIQYNKSRLDEFRFLVSYETLSFTDPDRYIKNACYIYDNALALITFLARGTSKDLDRAKILADAFVYALKHDRSYKDEGERRLRNAYMSGDLIDNVTKNARIPGWWDPDKKTWYEDKYQVSTHTGNLAWVMIALLSYYEQKGGSDYLDAAKELGEWIYSKTYDTRGAGGYNGGYEGWEKTDTNPSGPTEVKWKSTEHNIDNYVAFMELYETNEKDKTNESYWKDWADHAKKFVEAMWEGQHFWPGTGDDGVTKNEKESQQPEDVNTWGLLALENASKYGAGITWVENNCFVEADGFKGFDFNTDKDHVWFEGTAHMVLAYQILGNTTSASTYLSELRKAQTQASNNNGKGIVAASHDGLTTGFDLLTAGNEKKPWLYYSRLHVGATSWFIFAENEYNPYWGTFTTTPVPTLVPSPSPVVCDVETISVSPSMLTIKTKKSGKVTVMVTGEDGCAVEGETVTETINASGKSSILVSPTSTTTDASGQATFTITATKKTGNARVTFQASSVKKSITVKVRK